MDSESAGLFSYENPHDPVCARSRSRYVVTVVKCPILWISNLQTDIALSNLHGEYMALSQSLRDLLTLKDLAKETLKGLGINTKKLEVVTQ